MSAIQPQVNVILYSNADLNGDCVPVHADIADLKGFKYRAQSAIVIHGNWELTSSEGNTYALSDTTGRYTSLGTFNQKAVSIKRT